MSEGGADSRKHRTTVTKEKLGMIQNLSKENFSKKDISLITGLSISTVNKNLVKILNCSENDQPIESVIQQKGRKKVDRSLIYDKIAEIVQCDNSLTQRGIQEKLKEENIHLAQYQISLFLKEMKITRKRLKKKPATIVSPQLIEARKNYARTVRGIPDHYLLFLDETGFNLHTTNNYGYSPVNIDAYRLFPEIDKETPALNPIEEVFSTLKARYCSVPGRVTNQNQIISRVDQVIEKMNEELQFSNYYQHMRVFSDQAFSGIAFI
uniref:Arg_repressor domain-containing protein n=2 Tax=Strongyloides papillosus TaxID=174720 RepID=A0A0N5BMI8_STREA